MATISPSATFRSGRHLAAWLGLVPAQHSTGGKPRPVGLSKRGDAYLRRQLMHGARALVRVARGRPGRLGAWIDGLLARRPFNVVAAAVANKLARIVWAMLCRGEPTGPHDPLTIPRKLPRAARVLSKRWQIGRTETGETRVGPGASSSLP